MTILSLVSCSWRYYIERHYFLMLSLRTGGALITLPQEIVFNIDDIIYFHD